MVADWEAAKKKIAGSSGAQGLGPWVPGPGPKGPKVLVHGSLVPGLKGARPRSMGPWSLVPRGPRAGVSDLIIFYDFLTFLVKIGRLGSPQLRFGF